MHERALLHASYVNEDGIQQSVLPRHLISPRRLLAEEPAPSGHTMTTAFCSCTLNGEQRKIRLTNLKDATFAIGDLVLLNLHVETGNRALRKKRFCGCKIVAFTSDNVCVHRLVTMVHEELHISAPFNAFELWTGSEATLVEETLRHCSGLVHVASFCTFHYQEKQHGPCTLQLPGPYGLYGPSLQQPKLDAAAMPPPRPKGRKKVKLEPATRPSQPITRFFVSSAHAVP